VRYPEAAINPVRCIDWFEELPRERFLSLEEYYRLQTALNNEPDQLWKDYFRLFLLTAQRRGECAGMKWSELDLETGIWTLPPERTKSGRLTRVPLTELARAGLCSAHARSTGTSESASGLEPPEVITKATGDFAATNDPLAPWLADWMVIEAEAEIGGAAAYAAYVEWADYRHLNPRFERLSNTMFGRRMGKRFKKKEHPINALRRLHWRPPGYTTRTEGAGHHGSRLNVDYRGRRAGKKWERRIPFRVGFSP
jgi:hypothetical protein